jgi:hypothetical protein
MTIAVFMVEDEPLIQDNRKVVLGLPAGKGRWDCAFRG